MSIRSVVLRLVPPKTQTEAPPPASPRAVASQPVEDAVESTSRPTRKRTTHISLVLAEPKRGEKVGQGCYLSDKFICAPLCGTCIDPTGRGPKGLLCFCIPLCFDH